MRWITFTLSFIVAVLGVVSFLLPVSNVLTALLLIAGAAGLVWATWF